jgi:hypothetical protein
MGTGVAWRGWVKALRWWVVFGRSERRRGTDVTGKATAVSKCVRPKR